MSALGRLQASLATATQETTLALANLNFDFSLVKVEAPAEYKGFGTTLSPRRRTAAESGPSHSTARKLGSLFESILPHTPKLISSYGRRASELSESPAVNPVGTAEHGAFQEFVGADGTNIWAAATSGSSAVAVHLLACMLAAMWEASEATAIWEELVIERKRRLHTADTSMFTTIEDLARIQLAVSKEQLAQWDSSARAWLRVANLSPIVKTRHTKLMLILKNISVPVANHQNLYDSVIEAWKLALETMEMVLSGVSYSVRNGAILVALSAWHLYPDLVVLGRQKEQTLTQKDSLFPEGVQITIGLTKARPAGSSGVEWSLSLKYLRYYGPPIMKSRSMDTSDSDRWTFSRYSLVIVGALLGCWRLKGAELQDGMDFICLLDSLAQTLSKMTDAQSSVYSCFEPLTIAINSYRNARGLEKLECEKLFNLGWRHSKTILGESEACFSFETDITADILMEQNDQINFLRSRITKEHPNCANQFILYYNSRDRFEEYPTDAGPFLCTAAPLSKYGVNCRWVEDPEVEKTMGECILPLAQHFRLIPDSFRSPEVVGFTQRYPSKLIWSGDPAVFCGDKCQDSSTGTTCEQAVMDPLSSTLPLPQQGQSTTKISRFKAIHSAFASLFASKKSKVVKSEELVQPNAYVLYKESGHSINSGREGQALLSPYAVEFQFVESYGNVAIYRCRPFTETDPTNIMSDYTNLKRINKLLEDHILNIHKLIQICRLECNGVPGAPFNFLRVFASLHLVYRDIPGATISPRVIDSDIRTYQWFKSIVDNDPETQRHHQLGHKVKTMTACCVTRHQVFAAICFLESGSIDIDPRDCKKVFAVSAGDSIYIAAPLLCDPGTSLEPYTIRRVIGNMGRPGLTLLIHPAVCELRQANPENWKFISHSDFDGRLEDKFQSTSLHFGYTGYELPADIRNHGSRYGQAFFVEAVIAVHDSGQWVADIDILQSLGSNNLQRLMKLPKCVSKSLPVKPSMDLKTITNWEEVLDPPLSPAVFETHANWQARLAAVSICVRVGKAVFLFQGHNCWDCADCSLKTFLNRKNEKTGEVTIAEKGNIVFVL